MTNTHKGYHLTSHEGPEDIVIKGLAAGTRAQLWARAKKKGISTSAFLRAVIEAVAEGKIGVGHVL